MLTAIMSSLRASVDGRHAAPLQGPRASSVPVAVRASRSGAGLASAAGPRADSAEVQRALHPRQHGRLGFLRRPHADRLLGRGHALARAVVPARTVVRVSHHVSAHAHLPGDARLRLAVNVLELGHRFGGRDADWRNRLRIDWQAPPVRAGDRALCAENPAPVTFTVSFARRRPSAHRHPLTNQFEMRHAHSRGRGAIRCHRSVEFSPAMGDITTPP